MSHDVVVVGAGIVGLAHALAAVRRGLRVAVVERDAWAVGASVRNFGFITVTGQRAGDTWRRARRSREVWLEVAQQAGIEVTHRGLWVLAQRPAAAAVLEAFAATDMGEACSLHTPREASEHMPVLRTEHATAALYSPHELRVESRDALPQLVRWMRKGLGVDFYFGESVLLVQAPQVLTARRTLHASRVVVCTGADLSGIAGTALAPHPLRLTRLQMLRVQPEPGWRLDAAVMADLSLVRYAGYAELPQAQALRRELERDEAACLRHGIHLIAVQSADGSLVVGDSHHDALAPVPFASAEVDDLILQQLRGSLHLSACQVRERWVGHYPTGHSEDCMVLRPSDGERVVVITSGTGASTAFAIAEEVFDGW